MAFFKVSDITNDLDTTNINNTKKEDWHKKLTPLDTHLQERFQAAVIPVTARTRGTIKAS
jgi:hypothetical protein